eukprot:6187243-Pleurochrysis_carterae.AAC.4
MRRSLPKTRRKYRKNQPAKGTSEQNFRHAEKAAACWLSVHVDARPLSPVAASRACERPRRAVPRPPRACGRRSPCG